jgi:hypothetical protein
MNKNWSFNKVVNILIFGLANGILVAGCGGGGGGGAGSGNPAFSYIADQQGGGFVGYWSYGVSSVANADIDTLAASGVNQYSDTFTHKILSGTWTDSSPDVYYDLIPTTGWFPSPNNATLVDSGDGTNITIIPTGEPGIAAAVTRTDLSDAPIVCTTSGGTNFTCPSLPGNYPTGSASYRLTINYTSNQFQLYGYTNLSPITDANGAVLTALPTVETQTFCDPNFLYVFKPQSSPSFIYNVFATPSCASSVVISTATTTPVLGTVTIENLPTGISGSSGESANVLHVVSANSSDPNVTGMVGRIYGLRAYKVWLGWMTPKGTIQTDPAKNKTAINAELGANNLAPLP